MIAVIFEDDQPKGEAHSVVRARTRGSTDQGGGTESSRRPAVLIFVSAAHALPTPEETIHCACGRAHTPQEWYALPFVARWPTDFGALELRVCTCGSCISRARPSFVSGEQRAVR